MCVYDTGVCGCLEACFFVCVKDLFCFWVVVYVGKGGMKGVDIIVGISGRVIVDRPTTFEQGSRVLVDGWGICCTNGTGRPRVQVVWLFNGFYFRFWFLARG